MGLWRLIIGAKRGGLMTASDAEPHPQAKRAFGWSHPDGDDNKTERFVTVLEIPPVDSPQTAVKIAIYSDIKKGKLKPNRK